MRNPSQLFFPCLESPLRFYLSLSLEGAQHSDDDTYKEEETAETTKTETAETTKTNQLYLSLSHLNKECVCVSDTPHEWCLKWSSATSNSSSKSSSGSDESSEDEDEATTGGVRTSSFVLQSVDRHVYLTCDINGELSTCTHESLQAKQELELQEDQTTTSTEEGHGSYTWNFDYEDASGMSIQLINTTYQRRLSISYPEEDRNKKPVCTAIPVIKKQASYEPVPVDASRWKMRFLSGELLFMSNPTIDKRLRCDAFGKLNLAENWKGWEVFRFVEAGNGGQLQIVSWTHEKVLYSTEHGKVGTTDDRESNATLWTVARHCNEDGTGGGVLLQSVEHGRYLCALSATELGTVASESFAFAAVQWELEPANTRIFSLASSSNVFLSSRHNGEVFTAKRGKDWEEWKMIPVALAENEDENCTNTKENLFTILSCKHGQYLGSSDDGRVYTTETLQDAEYWELEESPKGDGYIIISHLHGERQLYCDEKGNMSTSSIECQEWQLKPRMPGSISKNQMFMAGVAAATLLVASPISLAWGVAARAPLAAMVVGTEVLTAEALVYGVGTAVVGTSAAVILADQMHRHGTKNTQQNENPIQSVKRPLVAWRSW
jgi:hypothetical protein